VEQYVKTLILRVEAIMPLNNLLAYMKNYWFGIVGPIRFSVFLEQHRTNNVVASWHRGLDRKMIGKHLTLWKFITRLRFITIALLVDFSLTTA
jgi:hypothetical protein